MNRYLITIFLFLTAAILCGCKVSQAESAARTLSRDHDLVRSPYQYKVAEDKVTLLRVLRKMPVGETAADGVLRADIEKAMAAKLGAPPRVAEIRIFETHPDLRREVWVVDHQSQRLAFDVHLRPNPRGVALTVEGPVEIQGSL